MVFKHFCQKTAGMCGFLFYILISIIINKKKFINRSYHCHIWIMEFDEFVVFKVTDFATVNVKFNS